MAVSKTFLKDFLSLLPNFRHNVTSDILNVLFHLFVHFNHGSLKGKIMETETFSGFFSSQVLFDSVKCTRLCIGVNILNFLIKSESKLMDFNELFQRASTLCFRLTTK